MLEVAPGSSMCYCSLVVATTHESDTGLPLGLVSWIIPRLVMTTDRGQKMNMVSSIGRFVGETICISRTITRCEVMKPPESSAKSQEVSQARSPAAYAGRPADNFGKER